LQNHLHTALPSLQPSHHSPNQQRTHQGAAVSNENGARGSRKPEDVTALNSVIIPALREALHRRARRLELATRSTVAHDGESLKQSIELQSRREYAQEMIESLSSDLGSILSRIERWDTDAPVGMGAGIPSFLEGFLEEILVRIEPDDDGNVLQ
jgi:serine/threonine-protein kinase 24/25/MST4